MQMSLLQFIGDFIAKPLGLAIELNADAESKFVEKHPEVSATFKQLNDAWNLRASAPAARQKLQAELIANFLGLQVQVVSAAVWTKERMKAREEGRKSKKIRPKETYGNSGEDSMVVTLLEGTPVGSSSTHFELFCIPKNLPEIVTLPVVDLLEGGNVCGFDTTIHYFLSSKNIDDTKSFLEGKRLLAQYYEDERSREEQRRLKKSGDSKKRSQPNRKAVSLEPVRVLPVSGGGIADYDDDSSSVSDNLAISNVVQVFSKDVPVLKDSNVNYEGFRSWAREFKQLDNKTGRSINPITAIDEGSNCYLKALWETCDPPMPCTWELSAGYLSRDNWFREVEEMLRKAQNIPKIATTDLDLKLVDGVPQVTAWHISYSKFLADDESGMSPEKQLDKLLRSIECIPSQASIFRENLSAWRAEFAAMSPPQIFDAKALLSKVIRPLLLYSQACLESNERIKRKVDPTETRGKFHKAGGGNIKSKDQPIRRQGDPKEAICFRCNEKGHKANNCPKKRPFDKVEAQAPNKNDNNKKYKLKMMRSLCSLICDSCCEVRVGDKIFRALLDTGATYSHISPKLLEYAKSCGMAVSETKQILHVETATGERLPCHRQVELFATLILPAHTRGLEIRPITIYPLEFPIPDLDLVIGVQDIQRLALWELLIAINNKRPSSWSQRGSDQLSIKSADGKSAANTSSYADWNSQPLANVNQYQWGPYHQVPYISSETQLDFSNPEIATFKIMTEESQ